MSPHFSVSFCACLLSPFHPSLFVFSPFCLIYDLFYFTPYLVFAPGDFLVFRLIVLGEDSKMGFDSKRDYDGILVLSKRDSNISLKGFYYILKRILISSKGYSKLFLKGFYCFLKGIRNFFLKGFYSFLKGILIFS